MHPAISVILLTTLIGAGQGLFMALVTVQAWAWLALLPAPASTAFGAAGSAAAFYIWGGAVALALLGAGLLASFFHLGRPERAWRAAAQWRSSWLSREVIALPAFMAAVAAWGLLQMLGSPAQDAALAVGLAGSVLSLALFVCTGMIYAAVRFLAEWHTPLTPLNYTLLGMASGFTLAAALAARLSPPHAGFLAAWALALTLAGAAGRAASLWRNARLKPRSTLQSAIGIQHPQIVQTSRGFTGGAFNLREFFHGARPATMRAVLPVFVVLAFVLPAALLAAALGTGSAASALPAAAFALQFTGLLAERWFFFAQANHPQNLYYQAAH